MLYRCVLIMATQAWAMPPALGHRPRSIALELVKHGIRADSVFGWHVAGA